MTCSLVMTILAPDRPGIVESVAELLREHSGNWLESRLARLSGHFAGIVEARIPGDRLEAFRKDLEALGNEGGLQVLLSVSAPPPVTGRLVTLECIGQDRPGIVHAITDVLAEFSVNVESLDSRCLSAPMSGESMFEATMTVRLPETLDLDALEKRLAHIGDELMLDVKMG